MSPCERCGDPVKRPEARFCSRECASRHAGDHRAKTVMRLRCAWCQQLYTPRRVPTTRKPQRFCSKRCANLARCITMDPKRLAEIHKRSLAAARASREANRERSWDQRAAGMTPGQAARAFWKIGYRAGFMTGRRPQRLAAKRERAA